MATGTEPVASETNFGRAEVAVMDGRREPERYDAIVIGGGQAGLATGYHLAKRGLSFLILEAHDRLGESWRRRWDGLRLFTAARYDGLPGSRFPAPPDSFPTKDDVADFTESYAAHLALPVRMGARVDAVRRSPGGIGYVVSAREQEYEAPQVVIATGAYHAPRIPPIALEIDPAIHQLHSIDYRGPAQLRPGPVLVVGASNSGAEIAFGAAREHQTVLVGRDTGSMPFPIESRRARAFDRVFWFLINHVLTVRTPMGRRARPFVRDHGGPLERIRPPDLAAAGVERVVAKVVGVRNGQPLLDDGRAVEVATVIWCTGFRPDFGWIQLPVLDENGWPRQVRGVAADAEGLYFVGLPFLHSPASALLGGVGRDAAFIATRIAAADQVIRPHVTSTG